MSKFGIFGEGAGVPRVVPIILSEILIYIRKFDGTLWMFREIEGNDKPTCC